MQSILIISPDPTTLKVLGLSFELKGYKVSRATEAADANDNTGKFNVVLLDMIDSSNWKEARTAACLAAEAKATRTVLLLPRGFNGRRPSGIDGAFSLIVEKPYELTQLINSVDKIKSKRTNKATKKRAPKDPPK